MVEPVNYVGLMSQIDPLQGYISGMESGLMQQGERQNQSLAADQNARAQSAEARAAEMQPYAIQGAELGLQQGALALEQGQFNLDSSRQQLQMQREQAQRQRAFQERMAGIHARGSDVTLADFGGLMTEFPEYADALSEAWDGIDEGKRASMGRVLASASFALKNGNTDVAQALVGQFTTAARNSGDEALAATAEGLGMIADEDPQAALIAIGSALYALDADLAGQVFEAGDTARVQSSVPVGGGRLMVQNMTDGSVRVVDTATQEVLTGQAAIDARNAAENEYAASQGAVAGERAGASTEARLGAEIDLGGTAQQVKDLASTSVKFVETADAGIAAVNRSMNNINRAIQAIDDGAQTGLIYRNLPDITEASAELTNAMNNMGLDVIGSVTFGALSEGELKLAMDVAAPRNLSGAALREWMVAKRGAQEKVRAALVEQARFLATPGNTLNDWYERVYGAAPDPAAPAGQPQPAPSGGLDFLGGY